MGQQTISADNLVLLGEMVEMASGYAQQCKQSMDQDDAFMLRLTYDQLFYLRKRVAKLDDELLNLEEHIRARMKPSRRQKHRHHHRVSEDVESPLQLLIAE
jgi:hypothetical protein